MGASNSTSDIPKFSRQDLMWKLVNCGLGVKVDDLLTLGYPLGNIAGMEKGGTSERRSRCIYLVKMGDIPAIAMLVYAEGKNHHKFPTI